MHRSFRPREGGDPVFPAYLWLAFSKRERVGIALIVAIIATQFFYAWAALGMEGLE